MQIAKISNSSVSGTTVYVISDVADVCFVVSLWRNRAGSGVTQFSTKKGKSRDEKPVGRELADYVMTVALNGLAK